MLKIKDNVDLKKLEKYGFNECLYVNGIVYKKAIIRGIEIYNYIIGSKDRIIHFNQMSVHNELDDTIYDLIQDGLIEKVEK